MTIEKQIDMNGCKNLKDFLNEERIIIERHIDEHIYFTHLPRGIAINDFVNKYGWLIRETFCDLCLNKECKTYFNYKLSRSYFKWR